MNNTYIILSSIKGNDKIEPIIKRLGYWCGYLPNSYILITDTNLEDLYNLLRTDCSVLILEVNVKAINGFLPLSYWEWFSQNMNDVYKKAIKPKKNK